jgi:tetratricopeptide (TPR) repeat protein
MVRFKGTAYSGSPEGTMAGARKGIELCVAIGDRAGEIRHEHNLAYGMAQLGDLESAETMLRSCLAKAEHFGAEKVATYAKANIAMVRMKLGYAGEALPLLREALAFYTARGDRRSEAYAHADVARCLRAVHRITEAHQEAETACAVAANIRPAKAFALAVLAEVQLANGRRDEAARNAIEAAKMFREFGSDDEDGVIPWVHVEALITNGRLVEAREAAIEGREALLARAAAVSSPTLRQSFLERIPHHAALLRRAEELTTSA